jgi:ABC-2 type transport system permease protein
VAGDELLARGPVLPSSSAIHIVVRPDGLSAPSLSASLTSLWADKFDHAAAVTNFVVAPLSLLSGTFYSVEQLSPSFRAVSHANPFFYIISGFRHGFLSEADSPIYVGATGLLVLNILLFGICYSVLKSGWKIKN